jgi:hypothetical protein
MLNRLAVGTNYSGPVNIYGRHKEGAEKEEIKTKGDSNTKE